MSDGDFVGGLLVGFIEAGKGLASICWLMVSRSNLSGDQMKDRLLQNVLRLCALHLFPIVFNLTIALIYILQQSKRVSDFVETIVSVVSD